MFCSFSIHFCLFPTSHLNENAQCLKKYMNKSAYDRTCDVLDSPEIHAQQKDDDNEVGDETGAEDFTHYVCQNCCPTEKYVEEDSYWMPITDKKATEYICVYKYVCVCICVCVNL